MRNTRFYIIIAFNILLLLLSLMLKPRFQTNDDIGMMHAFSGTSIFSEPTAITAFSTKIWGLMMVFLYKVLPKRIEVYTCVFYLFVFLSSVIIHSKLLRSFKPDQPIFWLLFIPLLGFISLQFYLELQFTMVSGLFCFAGILLMTDKPGKSGKWLGLMMFLIASMLRPGIVPVVLAFLLLSEVSIKLIQKDMLGTWGSIFKTFTFLAAIFTVVYLFDNGIHTDKEKKFLDFNLYRAGIVDFNFDQNSGTSLPSNWQKEELYLFKNWFYNDSILYSKNLDYKNISKEKSTGLLNKLDLQNLKIWAIFGQFNDPLFRCILLLAIIIIPFFRQWQKALLFLIASLLLYFIFFNMLSVLFKTPPFRVYFLLFTIGILLCLNYVAKLDQANRFNHYKLTISGFVMLYGLWITKLSLDYRYQDIIKNRCTEAYDPSVMYIRWAGYPFELVDPFRVTTVNRAVKVISMGAFSIHPAVRNEFNGFKYSNLTSDIIGKDAIISFMMPADISEWQGFKEAYIAFVDKHYHRKVFFEMVNGSKHCYGYMDYKIKEDTNAKLD